MSGWPGVRIHFDTRDREADFTEKAAAAVGLTLDKHGGPAPGQDEKIQDWQRTPMAGSGWISHYVSCDCPAGRHEGVGHDGEHHDYLAEINARRAHSDGCEHRWVADIRNVTGPEILDPIGLQPGDAGVVFGGPPCQRFSTTNVNRDPRSSGAYDVVQLTDGRIAIAGYAYWAVSPQLLGGHRGSHAHRRRLPRH